MSSVLMASSEFLPLRGGIGTYAQGMAEAAHKLGIELVALVPDYGRGADHPDDAELPFETVRYPQADRHRFIDIRHKVAALDRVLRRRRFDIVHAVDWPFFVPMALTRWRGRHRTAATLHGSEIYGLGSPARRVMTTASRTFQRTDRWLCNSHFTRNLFIERFPRVDPSHALVTLLGCREFWFEPPVPPPEDAAIHRVLGDDSPGGSGKVVLTTVARLTPRKGHRTVLRALAALPAALKERIIHLVIGPAYDEPYAAELRELAAASGVEVHFVGEVDDPTVRYVYSRTDVFVMAGEPVPGLVEGFGLVFLEAGAQGAPSIAGEIGGVADAVVDGETGFLVQPLDVAGFADRLMRLISDPSLRDRMGAQAKRYATELSWAATVKGSYGELL
ncbi:MAG TPA: glycosyltransferase family 4 protein [Stellaceae bacterium]|nr:glycosyltransferase family 4 protein [Stellaceae bacterium]